MFNLSNPSVSRSGPTAPNLVIEPNVLRPGERYTFRLAVTTRNPDGLGEAEVTLRVNKVRRQSASSGMVTPPPHTHTHTRLLSLVAFSNLN